MERKKKVYTLPFNSLGSANVFNIFERSLVYSPRLHSMLKTVEKLWFIFSGFCNLIESSKEQNLLEIYINGSINLCEFDLLNWINIDLNKIFNKIIISR